MGNLFSFIRADATKHVKEKDVASQERPANVKIIVNDALCMVNSSEIMFNKCIHALCP